MKAAKIPRFATTMIAVVGVASLCIAPMTFAQSGDGATPSASESGIIPGPPTSADELSGPPASAADGSSGTLDDSSGSPPASHTDWEQVPETNSDATSDEGQVLEIPQSVDPNQAAAPESKSPEQASNDGQGAESAQAPDELGGLNDYQSQDAEVSGGYVIPVPVLVPVPASPGFAAGPRMGAPTQPAPGMGGVGPISPPFPPGGFRPTPPIVLRPGGFAGIPSTSPMLTPPSGSTASPGGWWTRTH